MENEIKDEGKELISQEKNKELLQVEKLQQNGYFLKVAHDGLSVVNQIKDLTLLTGNDLKKFQKAQTFILSTYTDVPEYRPIAIKLASVLNDGHFPTADTKYWQCKKEAEVHFYELVSDIYKMRRCSIDVDEISYLIASYKQSIESNISVGGKDPILLGFEVERLSIKKEEYLFNMKRLEKTIKYRVTEITDWANIASSLEPKCSYSVKNYGEHFIDSFRKSLEFEIANSKDEKTRKNFQSQLDTLNGLFKS